MVSRERLLKIARSVRRALEKEATQFEQYKDRTGRDRFGNSYAWCSYGQCDLSSQVLEQVLLDEGIKDVVYIMGLVATEEPNPSETDLDEETKEELGIPLDMFAAYHYWLEIGHDKSNYEDRRPPNIWVVDITADQFNDLIEGKKFPQVIVAKYRDLPRHFRTGPA